MAMIARVVVAGCQLQLQESKPRTPHALSLGVDPPPFLLWASSRWWTLRAGREEDTCQWGSCSPSRALAAEIQWLRLPTVGVIYAALEFSGRQATDLFTPIFHAKWEAIPLQLGFDRFLLGMPDGGQLSG